MPRGWRPMAMMWLPLNRPASMRTAAAALHGDTAINWINDRLPALGVVSRSGLSFDLILLSAVWDACFRRTIGVVHFER